MMKNGVGNSAPLLLEEALFVGEPLAGAAPAAVASGDGGGGVA